MIVVRELTGGIYFGDKLRDGDRASDLCVYTVTEVERIVRTAARIARGRRKKLTSVDKANVLETSRLWREVTIRVMAEEFPDVALSHMLVDACAMHLIRRPADFDVIVTENMFGDILTDEASMLAGSMGMLPSASLGEGKRGLYEPIHGSAPDIAGKGVANPYATILSLGHALPALARPRGRGARHRGRGRGRDRSRRSDGGSRPAGYRRRQHDGGGRRGARSAAAQLRSGAFRADLQVIARGRPPRQPELELLQLGC